MLSNRFKHAKTLLNCSTMAGNSKEVGSDTKQMLKMLVKLAEDYGIPTDGENQGGQSSKAIGDAKENEGREQPVRAR